MSKSKLVIIENVKGVNKVSDMIIQLPLRRTIKQK